MLSDIKKRPRVIIPGRLLKTEINWNQLSGFQQKTARAGGFLLESNHIFISISTPAGKVRFIRASIILGLGFIMSISLLWVLISYCSLASL